MQISQPGHPPQEFLTSSLLLPAINPRTWINKEMTQLLYFLFLYFFCVVALGVLLETTMGIEP